MQRRKKKQLKALCLPLVPHRPHKSIFGGVVGVCAGGGLW